MGSFRFSKQSGRFSGEDGLYLRYKRNGRRRRVWSFPTGFCPAMSLRRDDRAVVAADFFRKLEADEMTKDPKRQVQLPVNRGGDTSISKLTRWHTVQSRVFRANALGLLLIFGCGVAAAQGDSPPQLRRYIDEQAGGIGNL